MLKSSIFRVLVCFASLLDASVSVSRVRCTGAHLYRAAAAGEFHDFGEPPRSEMRTRVQSAFQPWWNRSHWNPTGIYWFDLHWRFSTWFTILWILEISMLYLRPLVAVTQPICNFVWGHFSSFPPKCTGWKMNAFKITCSFRFFRFQDMIKHMIYPTFWATATVTHCALLIFISNYVSYLTLKISYIFSHTMIYILTFGKC